LTIREMNMMTEEEKNPKNENNQKEPERQVFPIPKRRIKDSKDPDEQKPLFEDSTDEKSSD